MSKQFQFKHMEQNNAPSMLNTSTTQSGVPVSLQSVAKNEPSFDGVTIEQMRGNPMYSRHDDIDVIGLAQKQIIENSKTLKSNMKRIRAFNAAAQKVNIPKQQKH